MRIFHVATGTLVAPWLVCTVISRVPVARRAAFSDRGAAGSDGFRRRGSSEGMTVHSECAIPERCDWAAPTLVGTTLYVRDRKHIMALDLR